MKLRTKLIIVFMAAMNLARIFMTVATDPFGNGDDASERLQLYMMHVVLTTWIRIYRTNRYVSVPR